MCVFPFSKYRTMRTSKSFCKIGHHWNIGGERNLFLFFSTSTEIDGGYAYGEMWLATCNSRALPVG